MKITLLLLILGICLISAKYLPYESDSKNGVLLREKRSASDESDSSFERDDDDDSENDNSLERRLREREEKQREKEEKEKKKALERAEKERRREEELKRKEEERQRKLEEKQEKEERKRQERLEKERHKQEEHQRKLEEKRLKEEKKRQEKEIEEIRKKEVKEQLQDDSFLDTEEENSVELEDIWRQHIYTKYGLNFASSRLEKQAALNRYIQEELQLQLNSTKSERRQAILNLIQTKLQHDAAEREAIRKQILSRVNAITLQKLRNDLEQDIEELNNKTDLLKKVLLPWSVPIQQKLEEKRTFLQALSQFLAQILPNWISNTQTSIPLETQPNENNAQNINSSNDAFESSGNGALPSESSNPEKPNAIIPNESIPNGENVSSNDSTNDGLPNQQAISGNQDLITSNDNIPSNPAINEGNTGSQNINSNNDAAQNSENGVSSSAASVPQESDGVITNESVSNGENISPDGNTSNRLPIDQAISGNQDPISSNDNAHSNPAINEANTGSQNINSNKDATQTFENGASPVEASIPDQSNGVIPNESVPNGENLIANGNTNNGLSNEQSISGNQDLITSNDNVPNNPAINEANTGSQNINSNNDAVQTSGNGASSVGASVPGESNGVITNESVPNVENLSSNSNTNNELLNDQVISGHDVPITGNDNVPSSSVINEVTTENNSQLGAEPVLDGASSSVSQGNTPDSLIGNGLLEHSDVTQSQGNTNHPAADNAAESITTGSNGDKANKPVSGIGDTLTETSNSDIISVSNDQTTDVINNSEQSTNSPNTSGTNTDSSLGNGEVTNVLQHQENIDGITTVTLTEAASISNNKPSPIEETTGVASQSSGNTVNPITENSIYNNVENSSASYIVDNTSTLGLDTNTEKIISNLPDSTNNLDIPSESKLNSIKEEPSNVVGTTEETLSTNVNIISVTDSIILKNESVITPNIVNSVDSTTAAETVDINKSEPSSIVQENLATTSSDVMDAVTLINDPNVNSNTLTITEEVNSVQSNTVSESTTDIYTSVPDLTEAANGINEVTDQNTVAVESQTITADGVTETLPSTDVTQSEIVQQKSKEVSPAGTTESVPVTPIDNVVIYTVDAEPGATLLDVIAQ